MCELDTFWELQDEQFFQPLIFIFFFTVTSCAWIPIKPEDAGPAFFLQIVWPWRTHSN